MFLPASLVVLVAGAICVHAGAPSPRSPPHLGSVASTLSQGVRDDRADVLKNWHEVVTLMRQNPSLWNEAVSPEEQMEPVEDNIDVPFTCNSINASSTVPTSVHALRPGDINIVAALGDSITAGMGIRARMGRPWSTFYPNKGESFSVGGERSLEENSITLVNILRKYNPAVQGASYCARTRANKYAGFNVAIPGDTNRGMESQARELINKVIASGLDNFYYAWKVVTLLIGGNDLCQHCIPLRGDDFSSENYMLGIKAALDMMHKHLPRTFVNVMIMNDVGVVQDLIHPSTPDFCNRTHHIECACAMNKTRAEMRELQMEYYEKVNALIETDLYEDREDFAVVVQPFLRDQDPLKNENGDYDMSFISPDCFHPSHKAHQAFAILLWNNMFVPVGEKPFKTPDDMIPHYHCPTEEQPYFCTSKNCDY